MKYNETYNGFEVYLKHKGFTYLQKGNILEGYTEIICLDEDIKNGEVFNMIKYGVSRQVPKDKKF